MDANLFDLHGDDIHITYTVANIAGEPLVSVQSSAGSRQFMGAEISRVETTLGTEVSVTLHIVPDLGPTILTLLVPSVAIGAPAVVEPVKTMAITVFKRTTIAGPPSGQLDVYTTQALDGVARLILA